MINFNWGYLTFTILANLGEVFMYPVQPFIFNRFGKSRVGKGFSREELKLVGLTAWSAKRIGLPVDLKRNSTYQENVECLEEYLKTRHIDLEQKKQAGKTKKTTQAEIKLKRDQEKPKVKKKETPVIVEEVVPAESEVAAEEDLPVGDETPLSDLEGITTEDIAALQAQDIEYAEDLLGLSTEDIEEIAETSGLPRDHLASLVFQTVEKLEPLIPLGEVPGIGEKTAELLECSGIYSANQLARTDPNTNCDGITSDRLKKFIDKAWDKILNP